MKKIHMLMLFLTVCLIILTVSGCSKKSSQTDNDIIATEIVDESESNTVDNKDSTIVQGIVTAIDGNNITINVMPSRGDSDKGRPSDRPESAPNGANGNNDPTSNGDNTRKTPDSLPNGTDGNGDSIKQGDPKESPNQFGEEKTITITDESIISIENEDTTTTGALKDITTGSMIAFEYTKDANGNDTLSAIIIKSFNNAFGEKANN